MASVPLTVSDPGEFSYVEGQTYYNELLAHAILKHAAAMADEGYELSFGLNTSAWTDQTTTLQQQSALFNTLKESEALASAWKTRLTSAKAQAAALLALDQSQQNFSVRDAAILIFESLAQSVAGVSSPADPEAETELIDVLKAAFLEELSPGSGVYVDSVLEQLGNLKQALQDLKYNDEILEIPATPRPIRIHLQGKTIQQ